MSEEQVMDKAEEKKVVLSSQKKGKKDFSLYDPFQAIQRGKPGSSDFDEALHLKPWIP